MICDVCRQECASDSVIVIGGQTVCAFCKPRAVQELREGVSRERPLTGLGVERELTWLELLAVSWKIAVRDFWKAAILVGVVATVIHFLMIPFELDETAGFKDFVRYYRISEFFQSLVGVLSTLGIAAMVRERLAGGQMSLGDMLKHAFKRWVPGAWTALVAGLVVGLFMLLLIVPGIIWMVYYSLVLPIVALRGCSGSEALAYSKRLVKGRWWPVLGRVCAINAGPTAIALAAGVVTPMLPESGTITFVSELIASVPFLFAEIGTAVLFLNLDAETNQTVTPPPIPTVPSSDQPPPPPRPRLDDVY